MASNPPVKDRPRASDRAGVQDIAPEVRAQIDARHKRLRKRPGRMAYDLTVKLKDKVREVAKVEDVSQSDIVAWALCEWLDKYEKDGLDLEPHKTNARSLRFGSKLVLPSKWR